jgi:hypothetical protein
MQDLMIEMRELRNTLTIAINELKKRGRDKAKAEQEYRIALAKEILIQRDAGMPVTIISDICRGKAEIAKLKFERDFAETLYETCLQKIYQCKIEMGIIEEQMKAERRGE